MKDIGYYAGFLSAAKQEQIRTAGASLIVQAIAATGRMIYLTTDTEAVDPKNALFNDGHTLTNLTTTQLTALMRGLCDELDHRMRN